MFDILKKPKKASRKAALCRWGSESVVQARDIKSKVGMSKVPLGTGLNFEFIVRLRKYKETEWL